MTTNWGELEEEYYLAETERESFVGGLPNWLTTGSSGGGSVTVSQDDMGSVELSTGTTATGDSASITSTVSFPHSHPVPRFQGLGVSVRYRLAGNAEVDGATIVRIGLDGGGGSRPVKHIINHTDSSLSQTFLTGNSGGSPTETFGKQSDYGSHLSQVFTDPIREVAYHRYDDIVVAESTDLPFGSTEFVLEAYIETQDTSADASLIIDSVDVSYFTGLRR